MKMSFQSEQLKQAAERVYELEAVVSELTAADSDRLAKHAEARDNVRRLEAKLSAIEAASVPVGVCALVAVQAMHSRLTAVSIDSSLTEIELSRLQADTAVSNTSQRSKLAELVTPSANPRNRQLQATPAPGSVTRRLFDATPSAGQLNEPNSDSQLVSTQGEDHYSDAFGCAVYYGNTVDRTSLRAVAAVRVSQGSVMWCSEKDGSISIRHTDTARVVEGQMIEA